VLDINVDGLIVLKAHNGVLQPGASYTENVSGLIPNGISGTYYLLFINDRDGTVTNELLRINNSRRNTLNVTLTPSPDLVVQNITVPSSLLSGQQVSVQFTVLNQGVGGTRATQWADYIYLSTSPDLRGLSYLLGAHIRSGALAPGSSYTATQILTIPDYLAGNYYLIVSTDQNESSQGDKVYEGAGENNNLSNTLVNIQIPDPSNLIVNSVTIPDTVILGQNVNVNYTIKNIGSNPAVGNLRDAVHLSSDIILNGATDKLLFKRDRNLVINAGDSIATTVTAPVQGLLEGNYFGIASTNTLQTIRETNVLDNIKVTDNRLQISINQLVLDVKQYTSLQQSNYLFYKVNVAADMDLLIDLESNQQNGEN
jgi:hypothetical protein